MSDAEDFAQIEQNINSKAFTKDEIIQQLELKVSELITNSCENFLQLMYRLDIAETKLEEALTDPDKGIPNIASMIYDRQLEKMLSRRATNSSKKTGDAELEW
jgi:hypothetical protein